MPPDSSRAAISGPTSPDEKRHFNEKSRNRSAAIVGGNTSIVLSDNTAADTQEVIGTDNGAAVL